MAGKETIKAELQPGAEKRLTVQAMLEDNHSKLAFSNRRRSQEAFWKGEKDVTAACSDARIEIPDLIHALILGTISTGGNKEQFVALFNDPHIRSIINLAHADLTQFVPGQMPKGCGGLLEKDRLEQLGLEHSAQIDEDSTEEFVRNSIYHKDPVVQTSLAARTAAKLSEKPVMAAIQDHITGKIHILAVYWRRNGIINSLFNENLDPVLLTPEHYNPQQIYAEGLPDINPNGLPKEFEVFYNYVKAQDEKMRRMRRWYPDFEQRQQVQNRVKAVLWTTDPRPAKLRYPTLFSEPGSLFLVSQARIKDVLYEGDYVKQIVDVPQKARQEGLRQVQYALFEAVKHNGQIEKPFSKTNTLIIETSDYQLSVRLQNEALRLKRVQDWFAIPGNQIITTETRGGVIRQIGEFRQQKVA